MIEKLQKYQHYSEVKSINMNMLKEKKTLQHHQDRLIEKAKLTYLSFGKAFERETKMIEDQAEKKQAINEQVKGIKKQGKN